MLPTPTGEGNAKNLMIKGDHSHSRLRGTETPHLRELRVDSRGEERVKAADKRKRSGTRQVGSVSQGGRKNRYVQVDGGKDSRPTRRPCPTEVKVSRAYEAIQRRPKAMLNSQLNIHTGHIAAQ
ncbi:hypothetical protein E2C01_097189 [Portunus trituberculatus]|uniref:Uncharacterized protein n=1 Tax=Portunus trituberculatus TaxID=210409 RepID=A0A5B7JUJ2_PORTR|nr:hypothetical protein [Portunus trituberculatus]